MKKRLLSVLLALCLMLSLVPVAAGAETAVPTGLKYEVSDGKVTITDLDSSYTGALVIPSEIEGYPVTAIGRVAFWCCRQLTSVTLPAGVTTIGMQAFGNCENLTSVSIPESVTTIDNYAFEYCRKLSSVTLPKNIQTIGYYAFSNCGLTSVTIPSSITEIEEETFFECDELTSVTICEGVTSIGNSAFNGCDKLQTVAIPKSVTNIGHYAFYECAQLSSVSIPEKVTTIGNWAFYGCGITSVTVPAGVTSIGWGAFTDCTRLKEVNVSSGNADYTSVNGVLFNKAKTELMCYPSGKSGSYSVPSGVTRIDVSAFECCAGLTSVTIPDGVTKIDDYAFYECENLTSVSLPDSVTTIETGAFSYCDRLSSISIPAKAQEIGAYAFYGCRQTSFTVPAGVTSIGEGAFSGCTQLTKIDVSSSNANYVSKNGVLFTKDMTVLMCCPAAKTGSLEIPDTVTEIQDSAFERSCLTAVTIPESVTTIGKYAFCESHLSSVSIPVSVNNIRDYAFLDCSSLKEINVASDSDFYASADGVLFTKDFSRLVVCPAGKSGSYSIPSGTTTLYQAAFHGCSSLTSVSIPEGLKYIEYEMFYDCSSLTSVTIPKSVTNLFEDAFYGCSALNDVYYAGTGAKWNAIVFADGNDAVLNAVIHCSDTVLNTPPDPNDVSVRFTDVVSGSWYVTYIQYAVDNGFMSGTSASTFEPNGTATRAMFVQILYAMANKPNVSGLTCPFTDVKKGEWYYNAVVWAYNNNLTSGTSETTFGTDDPITREQAAVLLYACTGKEAVYGELKGFADISSVDSWAYTGMLWANQNGIINGSSDGGKLYLNPRNYASRAEIATIMTNFYKTFIEPLP